MRSRESSVPRFLRNEGSSPRTDPDVVPHFRSHSVIGTEFCIAARKVLFYFSENPFEIIRMHAFLPCVHVIWKFMLLKTQSSSPLCGKPHLVIGQIPAPRSNLCSLQGFIILGQVIHKICV